jgi:hypothetical protein
MSLRVALLAQRFDIKEDPLPTDVMVYRQPASDVPVPADWRQSKPAPLDGIDADTDEDDGDDVESNAAGMHMRGFERTTLERTTQPRRIGEHHLQSMGTRLSVLLLGSAVTCTLVGWVTLL